MTNKTCCNCEHHRNHSEDDDWEITGLQEIEKLGEPHSRLEVIRPIWILDKLRDLICLVDICKGALLAKENNENIAINVSAILSTNVIPKLKELQGDIKKL